MEGRVGGSVSWRRVAWRSGGRSEDMIGFWALMSCVFG